MTDNLSYIPPGERAVVPYLICRDAAAAIDFYIQVFGATEVGERFVDPEGKVGHADLTLSDSRISVAEEYPGYGLSPADLDDVPVAISLYVPDVDAVVARAEAAGARIVSPPEETFYGTRRATLRDPFGHRWLVGTHVREVSQEEYDEARQHFAENGVD